MTPGAAEGLLGLLSERGTPWPAPAEHHDSVPSTNDVLKERARLGAPPWSLVVADEQTAGRGRRGHSWVSLRGNLHLSVLLEAREPPSVIPLLAGLAVAEALSEFGVEARLKWPNDVLLSGRKVAGILAEALTGPPSVVVLGVGVNVAAHPAAADPGLEASATSLAAAGRAVDALRVAAAVLGRLRVWYDAFVRLGPPPILSAWREASVPWWGRVVEVRSGADVIRGVARDLDPRGALVLETPQGLVPLLSGEAREVRLAPGAPPGPPG